METKFFIDDEPSQYREFNLISFDQVESAPYVQDETIYRSVALLSPQLDQIDSDISVVNMDKLAKPVFGRERKNHSLEQPSIAVANSYSSSIGDNLTAPELPDLLMASHFDIRLTLSKVFFQIQKILEDYNGVAFGFNEPKCEWTGVMVNGSSSCKFQISIYSKSCQSFSTHEYVVEGNRLMGDGALFRTLFCHIKNNCANNISDVPETSGSPSLEDSREFDSFSTAVPMSVPASAMNLSYNEKYTITAIETVFRAARFLKVESKLEAARILCDLTVDIGLQQLLVDHGCLTVLKELLCSLELEQIQHHAVIALANLCDTKVFDVSIMKEEGLLSVLLKLSSDGPFQTAEIRRCAVHILASLCENESLTPDICQIIGQSDCLSWLRLADTLVDEKLKIHADRVKGSFTKVFSGICA